MHCLIFPSPPWAFDSFPRQGGRGAVKLAPLRRHSRGERLGWGGEARGREKTDSGTLILHCTGGLIDHRVFQPPKLVNSNTHDIARLEPDFRVHP